MKIQYAVTIIMRRGHAYQTMRGKNGAYIIVSSSVHLELLDLSEEAIASDASRYSYSPAHPR